MERILQAQALISRRIYYAGGHPSGAYLPIAYALYAGTALSIVIVLAAMFDRWRLHGIKSFWIARLVPSQHGTWIQLNVTVLWLIGSLLNFGFNFPYIYQLIARVSVGTRLHNVMLWLTWPWTITWGAGWVVAWGTSINGILALKDTNYIAPRHPTLINTFCILIFVASYAACWPLSFRLSAKHNEILDLFYGLESDLEKVAAGDTSISLLSIGQRQASFTELTVELVRRYRLFWILIDSFSFCNVVAFGTMATCNYFQIRKRLRYLEKFVTDDSLQHERKQLRLTHITLVAISLLMFFTFGGLITIVTLLVTHIDEIFRTGGPLSEGITLSGPMAYIFVGNLVNIVLMVQERVSLFGYNGRRLRRRLGESNGTSTDNTKVSDGSLSHIKMETHTTRVAERSDATTDTHIRFDVIGPWDTSEKDEIKQV